MSYCMENKIDKDYDKFFIVGMLVDWLQKKEVMMKKK
jgi:hypothetical protein